MNLQQPDELSQLLSQIRDAELIVQVKESTLPVQPRELYYGNREYKRHLIINDETKPVHIRHNLSRLLEKRGTQMLFRLREGNGKAVYLVGVEDNGQTDKGLTYEEFRTSLITFLRITETTEIKINKLVIYKWLNNQFLQHEYRYIFIARMSKPDLEDIII